MIKTFEKNRSDHPFSVIDCAKKDIKYVRLSAKDNKQ